MTSDQNADAVPAPTAEEKALKDLLEQLTHQMHRWDRRADQNRKEEGRSRLTQGLLTVFVAVLAALQVLATALHLEPQIVSWLVFVAAVVNAILTFAVFGAKHRQARQLNLARFRGHFSPGN